MHFETIIGIDVSKLTLDIALLRPGAAPESFRIDNKPAAIKQFFEKLFKTIQPGNTLVCAEHTGHYGYPLRQVCLQKGYSLWLQGGAEIRQRSGVMRYKNDQADACRIADYAKRHQDKALIQKQEDQILESVRALSAERELYVKERAKYKTQLRDLKGFMDDALYKARSKRLKKQMTALSSLIGEIERQIKQLLASSDKLTAQKQVLTSVDGVGQQVAIQTIIATSAFSKFSSGRKFACHVGVAPFCFESGTSQRSRRKVSFRANTQLKKLYHMAALSAIKMKGEFRDYFVRKVAEGKNKMTVINAVRAKIINRIFALIRDNRIYEKNYAPKLA